jgi:RES domain-containing protein
MCYRNCRTYSVRYSADYSIATIELPDSAKILKLDPQKLPKDWRSFPHPNSTQLIGDKFIFENKYLVMQVPSVVVQGDYNFLINPNHKEFSKIKLLKVESFVFDERLFIR